MNTQHTPGPWEIRPSSNPANGAGWRDIVSIGATFNPSYVGEALENDARLIAAAPLLLEALRQTEQHLTRIARAFYVGGKASDLKQAFAGWKDTAESARSAIAAATKCPACNAAPNGPVPAYCPEHDGDYSAWLVANNID